MHTPETETAESVGQSNGVGAAAKQVAERASSLARLELELAQFELKRKAAAIGKGAGFGAGAALVGLYAVGFAFATIAAALATFMPVWLALLVVTAFLVTLVGILGWLALRSFKRGGSPVPEQAIHEAKQTTEALKS